MLNVPRIGNLFRGIGQLPLGLVAPDYGTQGYSALPLSTRSDLPQHVHFREHDASFNAHIEVALREGNLFVRLLEQQQWREAPVPPALRGKIVSISLNDDTLIALDAEGWMYTMCNLLSSPDRWGWISAWGSPFWFGAGHRCPTTRPYGWSLSIIGTQTDRWYDTPDGKRQPISLAKVTQVLALNEDGSTLYTLDPWLARDYSYEVGLPKGGRLPLRSVSASGSVAMVLAANGEVYTKLDDFDVKGSDPAQFRYTWGEDPRPAADGALSHRLDPRKAPISLPLDPWRLHPAIPGEHTERISIHSTAPGSNNRELRVEGSKDGRTGFWHKHLLDEAWSFTATDEPCRGTAFHPSDTLLDPAPYSYGGVIADEVYLSIPHFHHAVDRHDVVATVGTEEIPLTLHTVDGRLKSSLSMRLMPGKGEFAARPEGLDEQVPRNYFAALEAPEKAQLPAPLRKLFDAQRFATLYLKVTPSAMVVLRERRVLPGLKECGTLTSKS